jgi:hypothetical protein
VPTPWPAKGGTRSGGAAPAAAAAAVDGTGPRM